MNLYEKAGQLPYSLDAQTRNEVSERVGQDLAARWKRFLVRLGETGMPTMKDLPATQRLLHYTQMTHPDDFVFLAMDDYLEKARAGLLPVLKSPRWQVLMSVPETFEDVRRDFINLYKQKVTDGR